MSLIVNGEAVNPTIFPDGTSQIWKLPESIMSAPRFVIVFNFENEGEIFHLQQLMMLIKNGRVPCKIELELPFLPYGRQDKEISNESTFALRTFAKIINEMRFDNIKTLDAHSSVAEELFDNFINLEPKHEIRQAVLQVSNFESDAFNTILAYPDAGACQRYRKDDSEVVVGHKVRDQSTGYITDYRIEGNPEGKDILIIDDICDGGMTFILFTKELLLKGANSVNMYVTHGIFSKGIKPLKDAGINRIFTKDGEVFASKNTKYLTKEI